MEKSVELREGEHWQVSVGDNRDTIGANERVIAHDAPATVTVQLRQANLAIVQSKASG